MDYAGFPDNGQAWYNVGDVKGGQGDKPKVLIPFDGQKVPTLPTENGGIKVGANVEVDNGGELDCSMCVEQPEISVLTVDCTLGGGTLKNVKFASTGTLYLTKMTSKIGNFVVPLSFEDVSETENLGGWRVFVNGMLKRNLLTWRDGKIAIVQNGMLLIVQ